MTHLLMFHLPEDAYDLECAQRGHIYARVLETLREEIRRRAKYEAEPPADWVIVQELFYEILKDEGVALD